MTSTLTDDDLIRLLSETAESFPAPEWSPDRPGDEERVRTPLHERPAVRWLVAASLVIALVSAVGIGVDGSRSSSDDSQIAAGKAAGSSVFEQQSGRVPVPAGATSSGSTGTSADTLTSASAGSASGASGSSGSTSGGGAALSLGPAAAAPAAAPAPQAATSGVAAPAPDQGRIVKSGQMVLEVAKGDVSATLTGVQRVATGQGGLVFASSTQESGPSPTGTITIRVPVATFEATVVAVRELKGVQVVSASTKAADVTAQYADLQTQIRTLKATRERYLVILGQANTVGEVLSVQQRIDGVSGQVDQLEGRLKVLGAQSAMSTLAVTVTEKGAPAAKTAVEKGGLSKAWDDAKDNFTGGVEAIVRASGGVLIVGLSLIALWFVGSLGYRVVRRRMV